MIGQPVTIDIAPNWEQAASMLCVLLKDGTPEGKRQAAEEVKRMGKLLDQLVAERVGQESSA